MKKVLLAAVLVVGFAGSAFAAEGFQFPPSAGMQVEVLKTTVCYEPRVTPQIPVKRVPCEDGFNEWVKAHPDRCIIGIANPGSEDVQVYHIPCSKK